MTEKYYIKKNAVYLGDGKQGRLICICVDKIAASKVVKALNSTEGMESPDDKVRRWLGI